MERTVGKETKKMCLEKGRKKCSEQAVELFPLCFQLLQASKCRTQLLIIKTDIDSLV